MSVQRAWLEPRTLLSQMSIRIQRTAPAGHGGPGLVTHPLHTAKMSLWHSGGMQSLLLGWSSRCAQKSPPPPSVPERTSTPTHCDRNEHGTPVRKSGVPIYGCPYIGVHSACAQCRFAARAPRGRSHRSKVSFPSGPERQVVCSVRIMLQEWWPTRCVQLCSCACTSTSCTRRSVQETARTGRYS